MKLNLKTNCENRVFIEGYVSNIKKYKEKKDGYPDRDVLQFTLYSININSDNLAFKTPIEVFAFKNRALQVGGWLKDMMLVEVEAKLRIQSNGGYNLQAVYITNADADMREVTIQTKEEKHEINK